MGQSANTGAHVENVVPKKRVVVQSVAVSPVVSSVDEGSGSDEGGSSSSEGDECIRAAREYALLGPAPVKRIQEWMKDIPSTLDSIVEVDVVSNAEAEFLIWKSIEFGKDTWDIAEEQIQRGGTVHAIDLESAPNLSFYPMEQKSTETCC